MKCKAETCGNSTFGYVGYCTEHLKEMANDPTHPLYGATVVGQLPKLVDFRKRVYELRTQGDYTAILTRYDSEESLIVDRRGATLYEPSETEKADYVRSKRLYNENRYKATPEVEDTSFADELAKVLAEMEELLQKKNKDYGSSYDNTVEELGEVVALVRLKDKYNRLKQLILSDEPAEVEETIEETLLDLVGYGIIELVRRRRQS